MLDLLIVILVIVLIIAQFILCAKQLKKKAYDGRILLVINIVMTVIWIPLSYFRLMKNIMFTNIAWFVVAVIYMIFTIWYTKMLAKTFK